MLDRIPIADVPRLDDWLGLWAIEQTRALALLATVRQLDWPAHLARASVRHRSDLLEQPESRADVGDRIEVSGKTIAMIPVVGTLMKSRTSTGGTSTVDTRKQIRAATRDSDISGILLRVDSPGGTVAGTDALAQEIRQARRAKPVLAQIEDVGASAAYWVSSQASRVYASSATSMIGSIGTMLAVRKGAAGEVALFRSGPHKGAGMDGEITEEQAAHLQTLVDGLQAQFGKAVSEGRRLSPEQLAAVSTGAVWLAEQAHELRLIDGVQPIEKTLQQLASMK
jgi:signal peptide peptidase SppA